MLRQSIEGEDVINRYPRYGLGRVLLGEPDICWHVKCIVLNTLTCAVTKRKTKRSLHRGKINDKGCSRTGGESIPHNVNQSALC